LHFLQISFPFCTLIEYRQPLYDETSLLGKIVGSLR
jgi:hypothetical protein